MTLNRRQLVDLAYAMTARRNQLKEEIRGDVERADPVRGRGLARNGREREPLQLQHQRDQGVDGQDTPTAIRNLHEPVD